MQPDNSMDKDTMQALSKALTLLIFRNGAVETLHAKGACLDNSTMAQLNRDVNNRFYTLLSVWFHGTEEEVFRLEHTLTFLAKYYGQDWDPAQRVDFLI